MTLKARAKVMKMGSGSRNERKRRRFKVVELSAHVERPLELRCVRMNRARYPFIERSGANRPRQEGTKFI